MITPINEYDYVNKYEILKKDLAFDENVANYFTKMLHEGNQDIIIIGHQSELYNIQRAITGLNRTQESKTEVTFFLFF